MGSFVMMYLRIYYCYFFFFFEKYFEAYKIACFLYFHLNSKSCNSFLSWFYSTLVWTDISMFKFHKCEFECYINSLLMFTFLDVLFLEQDLSLITLLSYTFSFVSHYKEYNNIFELFLLTFCIFFGCSACFEAVCGYDSYKNWRSSCSFSQVGRNWEATHICWDRECALCLPANRSSVLATCDKQTKQHPWRFGDFEAAL